MSLKNITKKIIASTMALSIVFGNFSLCGLGIAKVIAEDSNIPETIIELENQKYVQYKETITQIQEGEESQGETNQEENKEEVNKEIAGVAIQSNLSIYSNFNQDTYLPTENVEMEIAMPSINGIFPEKANVVEAITKATTGEDSNKNINQNYDSNSGLLTISYQNIPNEEGAIYSNYVENAKDELKVIYTYPAEAYIENNGEVKLNYTLKTKISFKTESGNIISENENSIELIETENKGDLTTFGITDLKENIYKGFMYSNVQNKTSYDTEFKTVSTFGVLNTSLIEDSLTIELAESQFILNDEEKTKISSNGNIIYKSTKISKYDFDKMLGQDGYMEFYKDEEIIATVKYLEIGEQENKKLVVVYSQEDIIILEDNLETVIVEYDENITSLKVKMSKPILEGFIYFENQNTIKPADDYGCEIEKIKYICVDGIVNNYTHNTRIEILEPKIKISANLSNINFSTLQNNRTTLTINLDSTNISTKLFNRPVITVKLPEGVVGGKVSSPTIVNGNGLAINEENVKAENNIITIKLQGKQTSYDLTNVSGGASIVMDIENLDYRDILPTHADKIEVTCMQDNETVSTECNVNIVSKEGLLMISKLSNYNQKGETVTTMDSQIKTVEIESNMDKKEVVHTLNLVNNYDENLTNVQIIGGINYSNNDITSTFNAELSKQIQINDENAKVYYSTNVNANYDDETWQEEFTKDAKVFKIVFNNNNLQKAESKEIKTYINIPANLGVNQENYLKWNIVCNYKENTVQTGTTIGMLTEKKELEKNTIETQQVISTQEGNNVPVTVSVTPCITEEYVHSGQLVIYKIKVQNNGDQELQDLVLKNIIPENAIYTYKSIVGTHVEATKDRQTKLKEWKIEKLSAGEIQEYTIGLTMADVTAEQQIINNVQLNYNNQTISQESSLMLKPANIEVTLGTIADTWLSKGEVSYNTSDRVSYIIKVKNVTQESLSNININYVIPDGLEYTESGLAAYDEFEGYYIKEKIENSAFEYNIEKLEKDEEIYILVKCRVKELQEINGNNNIGTIVKARLGEDTYESNIKNINTSQAIYKINLTSNINEGQILKVGDTVTYTINIENIGTRSGTITLKDSIPTQIEVNKVEYGKDLESICTIVTSSQDIELALNLDAGEKETVKITGVVSEQEVEKTTNFELKNVAKIIVGDSEIVSNEVNLNLLVEVENNNVNNDNVDEENKEDNQNNGNNNQSNTQGSNNNANQENVQPITYTISGTAWLDQNKDGKKDENEKLQENVKVSLVNKDIGNYVLDTNGNIITTTTNNEGKYTFNNIAKGNYIVLFEFDTNTYTVTTYKKSNVNDEVNSDAILSTVKIDGTEKLVAVTDSINLDSNKENINIGLIENAIFDLSLDKKITNITVVNSKGTESYNYENGDTAKVDLVAKYMNGAEVTVTYKFTIKNEGEVVGYVNSLVDSLPSGLEFSSQLNENWYKGSDGNLYTTALSEKAIKPGENIEIELVLTKTMTEESTGVFTNNAKLEKISNLENIQEKEEAKENNQSSAMLIISIKTGTVIMYIGLTIACLAIICTGVYFIKKKILGKEI